MANPAATTVDEVLITDLSTRPSRSPDFEAESKALVELAKVMAQTPTKVFQRLSDIALELCRAGSAGTSILEPGEENVFRWRAVAGEFARYLGSTMPRNSSPCGEVLDRNRPLLMSDPLRFYSGPEFHVPVRELLLVPFCRDNVAIGTVWLVAHAEDRKFDGEDLRVLTSLTEFAGAAVQTLSRIEEAERAEFARRDIQARLEATLAATEIGTWTWDVKSDRVFADRNLAQMFGVTAEDADGGPISAYTKFIHADDRERVGAIIGRAVAAGDQYEAEYRIVAPSEEVRWVLARGRIERGGDGLAARFAGVIIDVTEQKRGEAALRESEIRFRTLVETLPDAVFINVGGRIVFCNPAYLRLLGADDPAQVLGRHPLDFYTPAYHDLIRGRIAALRETRRPMPPVEEEALRLDGRAVPVLVTAMPITDARATAALVVLHDLTDRKRVEERLREQEELIRDAAELAHVGGWSFDPVTLDLEWTAETARIHGLPIETPPNVAAAMPFFDEADRPRLEAALKAAIDYGTPYDLELNFTAADGVKKRARAICRPLVEGGRVVRVRGSFQDVTERHELEEKLRQSQKMDAFGQLAGGVAHDFNNMLQVINGYAVLLKKELPPNDPKVELVDEIRQAGERSAALTRQLLAFARQQVVAPKILDLSAAAADTIGMLRRLIGEDVRLLTDLGPGVWSVLIDPGQLEQILLNLAVNARDAMPGGGTLTISARNVAVSERSDMKAGQYAVLSVRDTGTGMPPDVLQRIFEPFFTTKDVGQGTGLGLATVYGIVQQARGHVRVKSKLGEGSTFEVFLPRTKEGNPDATDKSGIRSPVKGKETILVVEDEAAVRGLVKMVLSGGGYTVLAAGDGLAAERVAAAHAGPIHLILSDVVMPGMGGRAAVAGVLAKHPEAKVVFMSGYTDDAVTRKGVSAADVPFLQKPFSPDSLTAKVREVLDAPQ